MSISMLPVTNREINCVLYTLFGIVQESKKTLRNGFELLIIINSEQRNKQFIGKNLINWHETPFIQKKKKKRNKKNETRIS